MLATPAFDLQMAAGQGHIHNEDWEDWLRWDPAAETSSPDDTTFNSGSSKNDSPVQDHVLPMGDLNYEKDVSGGLSMYMLDESSGMNLANGLDVTNGQFLFGLQEDINAPFAADQSNAFAQMPAAFPKLDTNTAAWSIPQTTSAEANSTLFAVSDGNPSLPATTPASANSSQGNSPTSVSRKGPHVASNSPEAPKKRGGRKRKAETPPEVSMDMNDDSGENNDGDGPPVKKTSHNVIEKRYRNNLNDKIVELRNSVPSLRAMGRANGGKESEDLEGLTPAHKLNKATVMAKATEYIRHLEKRNRNMADEMATLKARLSAVETALGRDGSSSSGSSPGSSHSRKASVASQVGAPTFLNVTQEQNRYGQPTVSQQYRTQQNPPTYARPPNPPVEAQNQPQFVNGRGGVMNKVMLGAMAGVMIMEGVSEQQHFGDSTHDRSLSAIPVSLFKRAFEGGPSLSSNSMSTQAAVPLLKLIILVGVIAYLITSLLTSSSHRSQKARTAVMLPQAPSLASPVEVRRKAWLTAIQSVWVPKHFLLEVVTVCTKMIQLSVRRVIGSEAFTEITGTSKEEEAARIKAWDIAIDAQLAGGDAEVSYYRLLLTLMESGTLPDSPTRLMQKAVHFRVFFWDVANAGYGNIFGFKRFTEKVGRYYWDAARKLQKEAAQAQSAGRPSENGDKIELLPDHLACLIELDCDEVLNDEMIQRAWNLAWNKPSANGLVAKNAARDSVVEDHAIRSPLDAVAAWYTNATIDDTLADALNEQASSLDTEYYIGLALSVAPPTSATHLRALAAKAVLSNSNRDTNIVAALEALPPTISVVAPTVPLASSATSPRSAAHSRRVSRSASINLVPHSPVPADIRTALTLAKLLALSSASSASPRSRSRAISALAALHIAPQQYTLLTAVAAYRLLRCLAPPQSRHQRSPSGSSSRPNSPSPASIPLPRPAMDGLEDVAGGLRVWIGSPIGRECGISHSEQAQVIRHCLLVAKRFGGWREEQSGGDFGASGWDSGYGTSSHCGSSEAGGSTPR